MRTIQKALLLLTILAAGAIFSCCTPSHRLKLPFSSSEVTSLEMYRYIVPTKTERKTVTEKEELSEIYESISGLRVKEENLEATAGSTTLYFRFHLKNESTFDLIYVSLAVKKAILHSPGFFEYSISSDLESIWTNCNQEPQPASSDALSQP